ncbi:E3 ubiquitin-protein ligase rnf213-beta-like isoform X2 [Triplophysa rosa]|uniref:E3 ubiquitin-protein ligase rnf213-beta-like isoform X2 n=1 Tax=Triplophysa rosa TaxID=992332 RepID=UPI002545DCFC|nr:E3 ubiquitin-protein ligase rnf213-beta-like isoform X2 [Triplophysa rosa]
MPKKKRSVEKGKAGAKKKGTKKRDASTSSAKVHKLKGGHTGDSGPVRPEGHVQPSTESEPHTQKSSSTMENWTQTKPVKQATQQTQTEFNENKVSTEPIEHSPEEDKMEVETQRNQVKEGDGEDENCIKKKKRKVSESIEAEEKRTKPSDGCGDKQAGDEQKETETKEKHSREDSQKDTDRKSGTEGGKSNAEAAGNQTKGSKEFSDNNESKEAIEQSPEKDKMEVESQLQRNQGNEIDRTDEKRIEKKEGKVIESRKGEEKSRNPSDGCRDKQDGNEQKDTEIKEKLSRDDSQKDTDLRSGSEGRKSYAEAAADPGNQTQGSKEQKTAANQDRTMRKHSPVRTNQPMFTFYVYAVLDKRFKFNKRYSSLLLLYGNGWIKLQIKHIKGVQHGSCLIEATFSVEESTMMRGDVIWYKYAVQHEQQIEEIAIRYVYIPPDNNVKELHLYEGFVSCSRPASLQDRIKSWFQSAKKDICEGWETSAHVLLDRVFLKWEPSNHESKKTFIQHLHQYMKGFQSSDEQLLEFPGDLAPLPVNVKELIYARLIKILNEESERKTLQSSAGIKSMEAALSVFQVCRDCAVNLGIKDLGMLCQIVFKNTASLGDMQTGLPFIDFTVIGLMNLCAERLISELVLLVPVFHLLRKPGAVSDPGSAVNEQRWAGLENIKYQMFRERIKDYPDKRRMVLRMLKEHLSLTKDKPYFLTSWLTMVAFEDVTEFAKLTRIVPEHVLQSLMYRMEEIEQSVQYTDDTKHKKNLETTKNVLHYLLKGLEEDKERIMESESLSFILKCCWNLHKSACSIARLVQHYNVPLLTFQLLLKVVEMKHAVISKGGEEMAQQKIQLLSQLKNMQVDFSKWRDGRLKLPVMQKSRLCYPKEIQLWNGLYGIESAIPDFSQDWKSLLDGELKRRVSQMSDFDKIVVCCLETSAKEIENSHANIQFCFKEHCQLAVKSRCQAKKEGDLLDLLFNKHMKWPVLSNIVIESAARFEEDREGWLLDPQSAISFFLSQDNWNQWNLDEAACRLIAESQSDLGCLIQSLCQGNVTLGHLKTILKYKSRFEKLYNQYKKNNKEKNISINVTELLSQRESDVKAFEEQRQHMSSLVKMLGKILDAVYVPELSSLEEEVKNDQQAISLDELVEVQAYFSKEDLDKKSTRNVLCYRDNFEVQDMAREMHEVRTSNLLLHLWQEKATEYVMLVSEPLTLNLTDVHNEIWMPCHSDFFNLGVQIANGTVCFKKVDQALDWCEDGGEGDRLKKELALLASMLVKEIPDKNWQELRFKQIQEYRCLHHAAESAEVILEIKHKLGLQGDFSAIHVLTQVRDDSFKRNTLGSLSKDLVKARQKLENVKPQHIACLKAFSDSDPLNKWVQNQIESLKDLKTFMDLATIPAGENDVDTDRIANFESAVMGYSPLLYSLPNHAGFEEFIICAQQVWDTLDKDEKLMEKLRDSCRWLDWLKGLRETFGSVEQSSLSQASAINTDGVYHVGWPVDFTGKTCLDNVFNVKVTKNGQARTYSLDELLELQNKLMLMSSKGEHGKEQVNKFTQVFEGVQRMGRILLQLRTSGNVLLRDLEAQITCNGTVQHCINISFSQLKKCVEYQGDVLEELQKLCRSLEDFHKDWCTQLSKMRSQYYALNYYTSEQMAYLCKWVNDVSNKRKPVAQQMWHLLTHVKPDCSKNDIKEAFEMAAEATEPMDQGDVAEEPKQDSDIGIESLDNLWKQFKENMSRFLSDHVDVETLGKFLSVLSSMNQMHIRRNIPHILCDGRPNFIQCPIADVISTTLSFYTESPEQPLPTTDEILMCQEETTTEEVEIFLRRCLGFQGTAYKHNKIYTLVNPGSLTYDVGVALVECFETLEKSAEPHYRLVMVCPVNQDRYVPSFFSNYKVQTGLCVSKERNEKYLKNHFRIPAELLDPRHSRVYPGKLSVWMIASERPTVGKSLYVKRLFEQFQTEFPETTCIRMRLIEPCVNIDGFVQTLSQRLAPLKEQDPVLLHIDTAAVRCGLEEFLFKLLVLGCLSDSKGNIWKRNTAHLVAIEALQRGLGPNSQTQMTNHGFLHILPTIFCRPPKEVKDLEIRRKKERQASLDPLMDKGEFRSEDIQRPYQYLRRFNRNENLDRFTYQTHSVEGDPVDCLHHLLSNCGLKDPSWAELKHFTWFLNLQLKDCENSLFCDPDFLADNLSGFKDFIVKFMIHMARDFASPSIDISDQSPSFFSQNEDEDDILSKLTIRKRWENESHPYIFFNADHLSMSFLGFHVKTNRRILNAVDPQSGKVLMGNVMSQELFSGLERQRINLCEDFDNLSREDKIQRISFVVGAKKGWEKGKFDPDPTYELTADNVMKMLAIHMRFRCDIPVIIMGETGCGKTRLVRFLCDLQKEGRDVENMKLVKVHGGTTSETIYKKVREAEEIAQNNRQKYELDTVLFFDEANTTEAIFAIKEVLCDKTVQGYPLKKNSGLKIIAACNPYRRHTTRMIERLERAGLGYRVKAEETEDRLGKVPMRQLVYRVHPLPPSMVPLVWDFGQLSDSSEHSYIRQIVQKQIRVHGLPLTYHKVITEVLAASQRYMRSRADECSFVSLRDVERSMCVLVWFFKHRDYLFPEDQQFEMEQMILKCLVLAVGVCYYPSLERKELYLAAVSEYFPHPFNSTETLEQEISSCQDFFLSNIETRKTIAKNLALKENVFLMVVCIELRIPLFLVGKPGSSKSLAKTVVADAMQRQASHCDFFKKLKEVHMVSFQCSPHSSPEGIIGTFWNCARFQKDKKLDEYVSVVVLDEIGLAEDSPRMPLKTLHPLLEDGCIDRERPLPHMKVGFVGISNWALDPAKMNRGIFVSRWDPSEKDLIETAEGICSSSKTVFLKIKDLLPKLAKGFLNICKDDSEQFFGLRDYYSLVKMIFATVKKTDQDPSDSKLAEAVLRNFSGQRDGFDPLHAFQDLFLNISEVQNPSTLKMIEQNLDHHVEEECRYLLLLTTNSAALYIVQHHIFSKENNTPPEIVFGSGFPKDQEYAQICRNVSRIKACMETGRTVILLNLLNLYESLYDALNQYYIYLGKQQYVDLGLGSHRVKCRVHKNFRLIVVEDQEKVYKRFPVPLKNRLEKHKVDRSTDMMPWQHRVLEKLRKWAEDFPRVQASTEVNFSSSDTFVGFHGDACASALLQALEKIQKQANGKANRNKAKDMHLKSENNETHQPIDEVLMIGTDSREEINEIPDEEQDGASMEVDNKVEDAENIETLGDALHLVKMNEDSKDSEATDSMESNEIMDEEEEVFETAKSFLLNSATPDAVLRLKYSEEFGNQEKDKLQRIYFHQQSHKSLRDLIESHLKKPDQDKTRFLEVTTFSSLLTGADLRNLAPALGLSTEQVHLLFLHQFDTEASFSSKIRSYLRDCGLSLRILLVQMDMEESLCKNELIASAKYCTMNEILSFKSDPSNFYTVFITKLSRIGEQCKTSGNKYIGFQGDVKDSEEMHTNEPESQKESSVHLNSLSLIRSCTQKAVSLLRDTGKKTSRSMERMNILLVLLGDDPAPTGERFQKVLLGRLMTALKQKEELSLNPTDWVYRAAKNREALQEGGTLRHTLWRQLQGILSPLLARVLEVLDRDCNLGLLHGLSDGVVQFWLDIFQDQQLLDLLFSHNASVPEQEINVQCHLFVGEVERPCAAPFSWLIKTYCQSLWEESEFVRGTDQGNKARIQQFISAVSGSGLGSYIEKLSEREKVELGRRYLTDYVLMAFKVHSEEELEVFTAALLGCVSALQVEMSVAPDLSPTWILAAAQIYAPRLDTLSHALQLNTQMVEIIKDRIPLKTSPDMCEDILAVGICVEETKLLPVSSVCECQTFLQGVEQLQPCLEQVLSPSFRALCSPCCLKQLDAIKSVWQGMLLVGAFIEQVVVKLKSKDERIEAVTLKHCAQLHGLMEGSPNLRSRDNLQQIIRILNDYHNESISRELRFGVKCSVCLEDPSKPTALPCEHVFCLACVEKSIAGGPQKCPKCRTSLPDNYRPTVSRNIDSALSQHNEIRKCCNGFFLEVVSRFCLTDEEDPSEDLVELLFSLLISAQGDVYKTRELTPFLECVDQSPVVRSVLLKLLLQYSFKQVKKHIQSYLENMENKLLDKEDRTELYRLFVKCFQDSLLSSGLNGAVKVKENKSCLQESVSFLSRLARKQTPSRQDDPAEFLLSMADLRMCLESAARILPKAVGQRKGNCEDVELKLLEQVKAVCEYCDNDWYRIYLLRALDRLAGMDCLQMLINSTDYIWIFPAEILRLHRLTPAEVDRFLCCGPSYRTIRDGVGQVMHDGKTDSLREALQAMNALGPLKSVMLALAMFRQVTCHLVSPERAIDPQAQELNVLKDIIRENVSGHVRELCTALLSNQIGGPGSPLSLNAGVPAQRRPLLELLVHASAVFYSGNRLLRPLHSISSQPQNVTGAFLPTMPDDHTSDVRQWLKEKLTPYYCSNGHASFVGQCGKPMELSKCATCGVPIGGQNHIPVLGFIPVSGITDMTRTGHILGNAENRSEAPNRNLSLAQSCVLRLCLHLAMLQGAIHHQQGIRNMIQSAFHSVFEFLWQHLEKDMRVLGETLNLNMEDTAIVVHLILNRFLETNTGGNQDLSSRRSREQWESTVCNSVINPVLQDLNRMLNSAHDAIASDNRLSNSPLMKVLKRDPAKILQLPSNCPTHHSAFWSLSPLLTVESITQQIHQSQAPLLTLFINKVHCMRQLIHLPTLAALLSDLMKLLPPGSETHTYTIASLLHSISAGYQKKLLSGRVDVFMKAWNHLRTEIANDASVGLDTALCETDMTKESSGQFLSISRQGPGTCLRATIDLLSKTHNSLVAEARKLCHQEDSDYKVSLVSLCESQLALCHPERQFLPLVLANCHYTLEKGQQTASSYDYQAIERELGRRFFAGKPRIQSDTEKYLRRQHQDFSEVLTEVRAKIPQEPLRSSVLSSMRSMLRSFTDVCDAVFAVEIGLRFLGKTGGDPQALLLSYLKDSLKMDRQISSSVAEALKDNRLSQCTATWQLLTCWRSEQMLRRGQDPFQRLPKQFQDKMTSEERNQVTVFLGVTDIDILLLELHEILQLKAKNTAEESFSPHWDIRSTMESRLEEKNSNSLPGLESLSEENTLAKAAEIWKLAVEFKH